MPEQLTRYCQNWGISDHNRVIQVDDFAEYLKVRGITHGKIMTSLASKILFLNDPWNILPIDNLVKRAVGLKENKYKLYELKFNEFKAMHFHELNEFKEHFTIIEDSYDGK